MNDLITQWLATLLDKFKAKNPKVFLYIQLGLVVLQSALSEIQAAEIVSNDAWIVTVLKYIGYALMILVGSRTYSFKKKTTEAG